MINHNERFILLLSGLIIIFIITFSFFIFHYFKNLKKNSYAEEELKKSSNKKLFSFQLCALLGAIVFYIHFNDDPTVETLYRPAVYGLDGTVIVPSIPSTRVYNFQKADDRKIWLLISGLWVIINIYFIYKIRLKDEL